MLITRKSAERGTTQMDWLESYHSFSFAGYHHPAWMGFGVLRVINEDVVRPMQGFATHGHRNMEIITYILSGKLEHKDSKGNHGIITPQEVQRMSAGSGIRHSEYNPSEHEDVHLLQIWIEPWEKDIAPSYEQQRFLEEKRRGVWQLIASPDARKGSLTLHQDVLLYAVCLQHSKKITYTLTPHRKAWLQIARGGAVINGVMLHTGDAIGVVQEKHITVEGKGKDTELLLFDLP